TRRGGAVSTILVSGTSPRLTEGLAAAIAAESAAICSGATLLADAGEWAQRRGATLFAAPAARELEDRLRGAGLAAAARGHLCHRALSEPGEDLSELAAAMHASRPELSVVHLPGSRWVRALETPELGIVGGCVLVSLPSERSLAALAVDEL